jgi:hypothetical protein
MRQCHPVHGNAWDGLAGSVATWESTGTSWQYPNHRAVIARDSVGFVPESPAIVGNLALMTTFLGKIRDLVILSQ